jgi:hypothetical protein
MNDLSLPRARAVPGVALGLFVLQMALSGRYGVFRDEMYYVACGEHLAFGYVDHAPLVAWVARLSHLVFGAWVPGLRLVPALCAAAAVLVTAELARALRGGTYAQLLAAVCVAVTPEFLGTCHVYSMNAMLLVLWPLAALFCVRALMDGQPRAWIGFGVACGLGLLAKHSTLFFGAGVFAGLVATSHRKALTGRGPWIGAGIALLLLAPNVAWEQLHGWPTLEFMHNAQTKKMVHFGLGAFLRAEIDDMLPFTLPIWAGGLGWLLVAKQARPFQFLGVAFAGVLAIVAVANGKPYYAAPAFPIVYAAGGVLFERLVARVRFARPLAVGVLAAGGALGAPMALPILDPPAFIRYAAALGVEDQASEKHEKGPLPQFFADQFGWQAMAEKIAHAYAGLSPEEREVAVLFGGNYGEAGAIDFFGPRLGLPPAASGHNTYFMWGPPARTGEVLIAIGERREDLEKTYADVREVDETNEPYAMPYENHRRIYVCRGLKRPLREVWPSTKFFI